MVGHAFRFAKRSGVTDGRHDFLPLSSAFASTVTSMYDLGKILDPDKKSQAAEWLLFAETRSS